MFWDWLKFFFKTTRPPTCYAPELGAAVSRVSQDIDLYVSYPAKSYGAAVHIVASGVLTSVLHALPPHDDAP